MRLQRAAAFGRKSTFRNGVWAGFSATPLWLLLAAACGGHTWVRDDASRTQTTEQVAVPGETRDTAAPHTTTPADPSDTNDDGITENGGPDANGNDGPVGTSDGRTDPAPSETNPGHADDIECDASASEVCDGHDNDCDGSIDEGVLNACGNCLPAPYCNDSAPWAGGGSGAHAGTLPEPLASDGTRLIDGDGDGFGSITIGKATMAADFAWASNEREGTLSKVDTLEDREAGRYATVLIKPELGITPYVADWGPESQCQQPSRTTIDELGNAYVANRANRSMGYTGHCANAGEAPNSHGSVTKIGYYAPLLCDPQLNPGLRGCQCEDRNGNGRIETSADYDQPPNGIDLPRCTTGPKGNRCNAAPCVDDADCATGYFCVRTEYPSQTAGQCSGDPTPAAPCAGPYCNGPSCRRDADCDGRGEYCVNGRCSTQPLQPEFWGKDDECLLWTVRIPGADTSEDSGEEREWASVPRAMAIDRDGYIWVGDWQHRRVWKLTPEGVFVDPIADATAVNEPCPATAVRLAGATPSTGMGQDVCPVGERCFRTYPERCHIDVQLRPYGAIIDGGSRHPSGFGYLWLTNINGDVERIDTQNGATSTIFPTAGAYGITVDSSDRPWVADSTKGAVPRLHRLNVSAIEAPATNQPPPAASAGRPEVEQQSEAPRSATMQTPNGATALWSHFRASHCVGADCDETCADDSSCPQGRICSHGRCSAGPSPWDAHDNWRGRGITTQVQRDGSTWIWAVFNNGWWNTDNWLLAFDAESGEELVQHRVRLNNPSIALTGGPGCVGPAGVGAGADGRIWTVNKDTNSVCAYDPNAPSTPLTSIEIGSVPYTYSDFTGSLYRTITNPQGKYRLLVQGCDEPYGLVAWQRVSWDAKVPDGAQLEVRFRAGATAGQARDPTRPQWGPAVQPGASSYALGTLGNPGQAWLEIEFTLIANGSSAAPVLNDVSVIRSCDFADGG